MSSAAVYDHKKVVISGFLLANIIHEATKSKNDAEGLLYGNISNSIRDKITDSDSTGNHQELQFALREIIPSENCFSFYNHLGQLTTKLEVDYESLTLLGWYKIRRNTSGRISLRERAVIKNLLKNYNTKNGLVFLLFTPHCKEDLSTYIFPYKCFFCQKNDKCPAGISLNVINLGHSGTHPEYRYQSLLIEPAERSSSAESASRAPAMPQIFSSFQNNFVREDGSVYEVTHIHSMYQETLKVAKQYQKSISETEDEIRTYENEILELRKKLKEKNKIEVADTSMSEERENWSEDQQGRRSIEHDDNSIYNMDSANDIIEAITEPAQLSQQTISSQEF